MMRILLMISLVACTAPDRVVVGSKPFAENQILAEAFAASLEEQGLLVERRIPYGDSFACHAALADGELDVYPDYVGTGLAMLGLPSPTDPGEAWQAATEAWAPRGVTWSEPLGFRNDYVVVTTHEEANRSGLVRISDLEEGGPLGIASRQEFLDRAVDGLGAMTRAYGIPALRPVVRDDQRGVFRSLVNGEAQLAVAGATDAWIEAYQLVVLEDDRHFFPPYTAAAVARTEVLERHPEVRTALQTLEGQITLEAIRRANTRVALEGQEPRRAAGELLVDLGLATEVDAGPPPIVVAVPRDMGTSTLVAGALQAVRRVKPNAQVVASAVDHVGATVLDAEAWVGVMDATGMHRPEGGRAVLRTDLEALAPLGYLTAHLLVRNPALRWQDLDRVGVGHPQGPGARLGKLLIGTDGPTAVPGDRAEQIQAVVDGTLEAVLLTALEGASEATVAVRERGLSLVDIPWSRERAIRHPYVRVARLPGAAYGVETAIETVATQIVLVGPGGPVGNSVDVGPAAPIREARRPLPDGQVALLRSDLAHLPMDPTLAPRILATDRPAGALPLQPGVTVANMFLFVYLGFLVWVMLRERPARAV